MVNSQQQQVCLRFYITSVELFLCWGFRMFQNFHKPSDLPPWFVFSWENAFSNSKALRAACSETSRCRANLWYVTATIRPRSHDFFTSGFGTAFNVRCLKWQKLFPRRYSSITLQQHRCTFHVFALNRRLIFLLSLNRCRRDGRRFQVHFLSLKWPTSACSVSPKLTQLIATVELCDSEPQCFTYFELKCFRVTESFRFVFLFI